MLAHHLCDRQRDDSQKMPRLHFNSEYGFSASASPEHIDADAELRERRASEVRQQLQSPQPTTHVHDHNLNLLNLATEQHQAVIDADKKGVLAWEEAKHAEALRKTEAAAAKEHTWAAVLSAQVHQAKDAQAASAGAGAAMGLPPHMLPHP